MKPTMLSRVSNSLNSDSGFKDEDLKIKIHDEYLV